ncbi:MAG: pyruvate ferredoxin oxidoreductase subunit gamma [Candidatus Methanofastidiosa archaeon]|nr:pyruvate ferredoxin oxidoreductase subunit gamma [Candidatus Methanofastidiosa archaeon]
MIEIRFHGRGGQGAVIGAEILAEAAFLEGKFVQAFPYFGVERRGAPVTAYTRIDDSPIRLRTNIYTPDHVVVLDPTLLEIIDVTEGLKENGWVIVNSHKAPGDIDVGSHRVAVVNATSIARKYGLGSVSAPIVNTSILGAVSKATGVVSIDMLTSSIRNRVPSKVEENVQAAKDAYNSILVDQNAR